MDRAQIVPRGMILGGTDLPQCLDRGLRPACVRLSSPTFGPQSDLPDLLYQNDRED